MSDKQNTTNIDKSTELDVQSQTPDLETDDMPDFSELFENAPEESRRMMMELLSVQMSSVVSSENAIMKKITPEHIKSFLDSSEKNMLQSYQEKRERKIFTLISLFLAMVFIIVIIILLKENPDVMEKIIYTVGGVIIGAFGGYGFGKNHRNEE